jgi:hypothetical protein
MRDFGMKFLMTLMIPAAFLTGIGSMIAGVWLLFMWEWRPVVAAFIFSMLGPFVLGFAMMPGLIFGIPAAAALEKGKKATASILSYFNGLYTSAVLVGWCLFNMSFFASFAESRLTFILNLILSAGVTCGTLAFLASKEPDNAHSAASTAFVQLAYALCIVGLAIQLFNVTDVIITLIAVVGGWTIYSTRETLKLMNN